MKKKYILIMTMHDLHQQQMNIKAIEVDKTTLNATL